MCWVTSASWALLPVVMSVAPSADQGNSIRVGRQGPFGASIFDGEEFELASIGDIEYEYDSEDYEDEPIDDLDDLYPEAEYGDYNETFIEPVRNEVDYEYDESIGPFGNSIFDFDDIETSPIADIEYEYDYEDYNYIDDTIEEPSKDKVPSTIDLITKSQGKNPVKETPPPKPTQINSYPLISYNNFKPIYQHNLKKVPVLAPQLKPKPRPNLETQFVQSYRFTHAELQYMYGKPRKQHQKPKPDQTSNTNPFNVLVRRFRTKMGNIVRFVTERIRNPKKLLNFNAFN